MDSEAKVRKISDISKIQLINQRQDPLSDLKHRISIVDNEFYEMDSMTHYVRAMALRNRKCYEKTLEVSVGPQLGIKKKTPEDIYELTAGLIAGLRWKFHPYKDVKAQQFYKAEASASVHSGNTSISLGKASYEVNRDSTEYNYNEPEAKLEKPHFSFGKGGGSTNTKGESEYGIKAGIIGVEGKLVPVPCRSK